jgi:hypothetical protein
MASRDPELKRVARSQLFVLDLRPADAPGAIGAQLGGPDAKLPVRWRDADSEVLVYPAETQVRYAKGFVFVQLLLATDQTGRDTLLFPFRVGSSPNEAVATAISETLPRGNPVLAARWGHIATPIVWNAVLRAGGTLLQRRKLTKPLAVSGVYTLGRVLSYLVTEPITAADVRDYFTNVLRDDVLPDLSVLNRRYLGNLPLLRTRRT